MTSPPCLALGALAVSCLVLNLCPAPAAAAGAPAFAPSSTSGSARGVAMGGWRPHGMRSQAWQGHGPMQRQGWAGNRFGDHGRDHRFGRGGYARGMFGWGAFDTGWTAFAPGWAETEPFPEPAAVVDPGYPRLRLPTAADLPVAGRLASPVGPAVLYDIRDVSKGRSSRVGGARIVSATEPAPLPGSSPSGDGHGGPLIIYLTAR